MTHRLPDFQTIRSEGGLLPPDLLRRVLDPREKLDGAHPEDYGLPQGERLNDVITQSWNRLRKHWAEFRAGRADKLVAGFFEADRFLRMEGFHHPKFLPYRSQLIPLATTMVHLGERWLEPVIRRKLSRWYWSGVLGELYGGAIETRMSLDLQNLLAWIEDPAASEPVTVVAAGFQPSRLDTLRTRTSAA